MRIFSTFIAAAAIALGVGFAGTAQASHDLVNGGAEAALGVEWSTTGEAIRDDNTAPNGIDPQAGSWFFSTAPSTTTGSFSQTIDVWGCGVEFQTRSYAADGFVQTRNADFGDLETSFVDDKGNPIVGDNDLNLSSTGGWTATSAGAETPANAATMTVKMTGTDDGTADAADVGFDTMSVTLNGCLDDFVKISGKIGARRGGFSFEGSLGTDHDDGTTLVGEIRINYKGIKESCTFTHTADPTYVNETEAVALVGTMDCVDKNGDPTVTNLNTDIFMVSAEESDNSNNTKLRGEICVDGSGGTTYDINDTGGETCTDESFAVPLNNGNIWLDGDTTDVF